MSGAKVATRIAVVVSVATVVVAVVGFVVTLLLNAFVLGKYDAYGKVPVPGSSSLHLPAGEVTVSFHTQVIGSPTGGGLPVQQLGVGIVPPAGVPDPVVTESFGSTTTVNNDSRRRVWLAHIPTGVRSHQFVRLSGVGVRRPVRCRLGRFGGVGLGGSHPAGGVGGRDFATWSVVQTA